MPTTAPAGWKIVSSEDFSGTSLDSSKWYTWAGQPGGDPSAWWDPSHVSVSGGMLHLTTSRGTFGNGTTGWVSGGVGSTFNQTYGMYQVRMRVDAAAGVSAVVLLWPTAGWPPEIDFYEDDPTGNTRTDLAATLHYGSSNNTIQKALSGIDFTQWHTIGVQWTAGHLAYMVDGKVWATVSDPNVPDVPMSLDMQTQYLSGQLSAPTPATSQMQVDWVVQYAPAG